MSTRQARARRTAALMWAACAAMAAATAVLLAAGPGGLLPQVEDDIFAGIGGVAFTLLGLAFATVGVIVAREVPDGRIGWVFGLTGLVTSANVVTWQYADVALHTARGLGGGHAAAVVNVVISEQSAGWLAIALLLFPDGRLPTPRWRPVLGGLLAGMVLLVAAGFLRPGPLDPPFDSVTNPLGLPGARGAMQIVDVLGWVLVVGGIAAGAAALVVRLRHADGVARQQLKLVLAVGSVAAAVTALTMASWFVWPHGQLPERIAAIGLALTAFPVAAGFAIVRRGLYGIDVAINRTLVYATLTALLAAAFALTVMVLGTAVGRGSAWATSGATLVVAVAFRPLRAPVQNAVDRRFNRAAYDAVHAMTAFLEQLRAGRAEPEEIEDLLRTLLGDTRLELRYWLAERALHVDRSGTPVTDARDDRVRVPLQRAGQPLGEVLCDPAATRGPVALEPLVAAGGLAIEIARLRAELRSQLAEVEASRARIVAAADAERRRIERDLHDGAQQRLVSIGLALRHAQHQLDGAAPARASATLDRAVDEMGRALAELRELAHGLPPAQLDAGLAPAFRELAERAPVAVDVDALGERLDRRLEAAAYFIGCEGMTNAVKHARATHIGLTAARRNGSLVVSVSDDGIGGAAPAPGSGLSGLADRVAALGGTLRIESAAGAGTVLTAELPCGS